MGPGGEGRRERQGSADPGSGIPATRPKLRRSFHLRGPAGPPDSGAAKGALPASFALVPLSTGATPRRAPASTAPRARTHAGTHPARAARAARAGALSASPAAGSAQPEPRRRPSASACRPYPAPSDSRGPGGSARQTANNEDLCEAVGGGGEFSASETYSPEGRGGVLSGVGREGQAPLVHPPPPHLLVPRPGPQATRLQKLGRKGALKSAQKRCALPPGVTMRLPRAETAREEESGLLQPPPF